MPCCSDSHRDKLSGAAVWLQAHSRIPAAHSTDAVTVLPAALSLKHSAVLSLPKSITAGVPAHFTIHPRDQFGNAGATGTLSDPFTSYLFMLLALI